MYHCEAMDLESPVLATSMIKGLPFPVLTIPSILRYRAAAIPSKILSRAEFESAQPPKSLSDMSTYLSIHIPSMHTCKHTLS
jgi:hypothetical protein